MSVKVGIIKLIRILTFVKCFKKKVNCNEFQPRHFSHENESHTLINIVVSMLMHFTLSKLLYNDAFKIATQGFNNYF